MALKSMVTPLTESGSWTARSPELRSDSTPTGRYFRWIGQEWTWAPSLHHCFSLSTIFLFRDLRYAKHRCGLLRAWFKWTLRDEKFLWSQRWNRYSSRWKVFRTSIPNTALRMYWRHILPLSKRIERARLLIIYYRVNNGVKAKHRSSGRKIGHQ